MIEIDLIVESLNELCRFNRTLFKETVSEQTICASLSQCILLVKREKYPRFNDYYVDVEYNRGYSGKKKAVQMFDNQTKEYRLKNVICDLVIHKRGEGGATPENLIAIEMKKTSDCEKKVSNKTESEYFNNRREADIARLIALTNNKNLQNGYGTFSLDVDKKDQSYFVEGFQLGVFIELCDKEEGTECPESGWRKTSINKLKIRFFINGQERTEYNVSFVFNKDSFIQNNFL